MPNLFQTSVSQYDQEIKYQSATKPGLTVNQYIKPQLNIGGLNDEIQNLNTGLLPNIHLDIPNDHRVVKENILFQTGSSDAVKGNFEENPVSYNFFSSKNINVIQSMIRYRVYNNTKKVISKQSEEQLYMIMRSYLLQKGDMSLKATNEVIAEIQKLNELVVHYCVQDIISELNMYDAYQHKIANLPIPLSNPHYSGKIDYSLGHPYL